ncbi:interleukin-18 receptor 1 [Pseudophryne corroboree]|uniref:interleukin-18 receptor 1 n=1 Tax=Pseudophryne corroboree TaxID=495146 RepID=UPI0030815974
MPASILSLLITGQQQNSSTCEGKTMLKEKIVCFLTVLVYLLKLGREENVEPKIKGVEKVITTEVELGQNLSITCESAVDKPRFVLLYWIRADNMEKDDLKNILNDCDLFSKICGTKQSYRKEEQTLSTELHIINITTDDIKYPYICKLATTYGEEIKTYALKLKDKNPDISKSIFTASIIAAITCSVSTVILVVLCILFRIQIVLLYRNVTGLDETIGDGKEYDAYLSFEGHCNTEAEERDFAFQTFVPILENHFGYKLCIFERDAIPGEALVDDVHLLLEKSRRLIVILSKNYITDKAMYEFESGLHKAMVERKIKVILIELTPISELSIKLESLQLLKMRNKVKWEGDKSQPLNSTFWKKIRYLMPAKPVKPKIQLFKNSKEYRLEKSDPRNW